MYRLDTHGRVIGGLFEACGATNVLYKQNKPEVKYQQAIQQLNNTSQATSTTTTSTTPNSAAAQLQQQQQQQQWLQSQYLSMMFNGGTLPSPQQQNAFVAAPGLNFNSVLGNNPSNGGHHVLENQGQLRSTGGGGNPLARNGEDVTMAGAGATMNGEGKKRKKKTKSNTVGAAMSTNGVVVGANGANAKGVVENAQSGISPALALANGASLTLSLGANIQQPGAISNPASGALNNNGSQLSTPRSGKKQKTATELYCICKTPWSDRPNVVMIACDGGCDGWFHPECLGYQATTRKGNVVYVDVDGTKLDLESDKHKFYCPECDLIKGGGSASSFDLTETKGNTLSSRVSKWCDVLDLADDSLLQANDLDEAPLTRRWKLLLQFRAAQKELMSCQQCKRPHHPMLPCAIKKGAIASRTSEPSFGDEINALPIRLTSTPVGGPGETFGLVVGGKYQTLRGQIIGTSKRWSQLRLDDSESTILVPNNCLITSKSANFSPPSSLEVEDLFELRRLAGVMPSPNGDGYLAYLDLDESFRLPLGRFKSKIRAARAYDFAARLQYGDDDPSIILNFPDKSRLPLAPTSSSKYSAQHQLWETALNLAHQVAAGPFASSSNSSSTLSLSTDVLNVLEWCESMLDELREVPPYFPRPEKVVETLLACVGSSADLVGERFGKRLEEATFPSSSSTASSPSSSSPGNASNTTNTGMDGTGMDIVKNETLEEGQVVIPPAAVDDAAAASATATAAVVAEDDLDIMMKKFIRNRNAKAKARA